MQRSLIFFLFNFLQESEKKNIHVCTINWYIDGWEIFRGKNQSNLVNKKALTRDSGFYLLNIHNDWWTKRAYTYTCLNVCLLQFPLTSSLPCNYEKRLGKWARLKNLIRAGFGLDWNPPRNKDVSVEGTIFVFDKHFLCISLCYKDNHKLQRFDSMHETVFHS